MLAVEKGLGPYLCASLHDALYLECPAGMAGAVAAMVEECFVVAGKVVTDDVVTLRFDTKITYHPDRYTDEKGQEIWGLVQAYLSSLPGAA
jgi:hypothetical protein